jgi:nicotinate-nucleotide--dimethylbenzimidazole phosphoribosyltransferase
VETPLNVATKFAIDRAFESPSISAKPSDLELDWSAFAKTRLGSLTKPQGSLGRLEEIATRLVCIQQEGRPSCASKLVCVFAADHGVVEEGVSAYPKSVTEQMVRNFLAGGAAINVLARFAGAQVVVVDVGVDADFDSHPGLVSRKVRRGTRNMAIGPAMAQPEMNAALDLGRSLAQQAREQACELVALGEMGIGNTTAASAITSALSGKPVSEVTGHGTGVSPQGLFQKRSVVERALRVNAVDDDSTPLEVLQRVGGLEIAAMTGMVLEAREQRLPVVIDGFISTAAAAVAYAFKPNVKDILFAGHASPEPGHRILLEYLGLDPILNLGMRLGEGTGAVLAMTVLQAAVNLFNEMATFSSAGVSGAL